jgi:autophagy-related protein 5
MFLSKEDSTQLWESVKEHNFSLFNPINQKLLNPQGATLRHLPVRLYLPHAASSEVRSAEKAKQTEKPHNEDTTDKSKREEKDIPSGSLRVVQALITPSLTSRESHTYTFQVTP